MNKKAISILLTAAMGVSVLAAGTVTVSAAEKKDKYVIGMSQCNLGEPWRVAMNDQIAMAAEKHPEFEVIFADAAQDNSKQIADIENFVQMGVDLIITSPNEATPLTNAVSAAYDAGIPVILLDRKIDGDKYTQFIGADNVDMGRIAGEYVADTLLPDGGKVCEIKGLEGTSGGIDRDNGFREGIKKNDKIEIVAVNNADWLREKAITVAEEMLQTNDEIDLFLALNDPMAEGAYIAAKNAGREGDILFVGFDGLPTPDGGIRSVMDGRLSMTQVYPTGGAEAIESAYQLLVEGKELDKTLTLTSEIVIPDNAEELLEKFGGSAE
ncbi:MULTISPECIES: substrate-binding domain-containing protein [Blautia]|uniref:ABC-type sugar transport system, periplasmic component n=2 Tax=Blautia obeum TaxID=40520 RepID=D4LVQ9_9FIRM|nr:MULTISPECIES: substrate-binding domain-containing protein [Blautia]RHA48903.1 ABC transporter substrate-binding protein [Blautia obeum]RHE41255.1 ABC transporter substrate-binding protein [Blautia obeum]CBL21712.1 ABC-type sugar transport system, periplasmic component [Blautia obeum A2-162]